MKQFRTNQKRINLEHDFIYEKHKRINPIFLYNLYQKEERDNIVKENKEDYKFLHYRSISIQEKEATNLVKDQIIQEFSQQQDILNLNSKQNVPYKGLKKILRIQNQDHQVSPENLVDNSNSQKNLSLSKTFLDKIQNNRSTKQTLCQVFKLQKLKNEGPIHVEKLPNIDQMFDNQTIKNKIFQIRDRKASIQTIQKKLNEKKNILLGDQYRSQSIFSERLQQINFTKLQNIVENNTDVDSLLQERNSLVQAYLIQKKIKDKEQSGQFSENINQFNQMTEDLFKSLNPKQHYSANSNNNKEIHDQYKQLKAKIELEKKLKEIQSTKQLKFMNSSKFIKNIGLSFAKQIAVKPKCKLEKDNIFIHLNESKDENQSTKNLIKSMKILSQEKIRKSRSLTSQLFFCQNTRDQALQEKQKLYDLYKTCDLFGNQCRKKLREVLNDSLHERITENDHQMKIFKEMMKQIRELYIDIDDENIQFFKNIYQILKVGNYLNKEILEQIQPQNNSLYQQNKEFQSILQNNIQLLLQHQKDINNLKIYIQKNSYQQEKN